MSATDVIRGTRMRAAVARRFGGPEVVQIRDVQKPRPQADEVLVKVDESSNTKIRFSRSAIHRVVEEDKTAETK